MEFPQFLRRLWSKASEPIPPAVKADAPVEADKSVGLSITPADVVDFIKAGHTNVELHSGHGRQSFGIKYRSPDEGGSFLTSGGNEVSRAAMIAEIERKLGEGWDFDNPVRDNLRKFKKRRMVCK